MQICLPDQMLDGGTKRYSGSFVNTIRAVDMHQCATQTVLRRQQCSSSYPSNITGPSVILDVTLTNDAAQQLGSLIWWRGHLRGIWAVSFLRLHRRRLQVEISNAHKNASASVRTRTFRPH
jgi:hypothetical protein